MSGKLRISCFLSVIMFLFWANESFSQTWDLVKEKDGIKIYTRKEPGNSIKSYKGEANINHSAKKVFSLIADVYQYDWWGDDIKEVKVLKYEKNKMAQYYLEYSLPWPLDNRDLAVDVSFKAGQDGKSYSSTAVANPGLVNEKKGKVRIKNYHQTWEINPTGDNSCRVILEGYADPAGNVPDWVVNMSITDSPFKAISGLRDKLKEL